MGKSLSNKYGQKLGTTKKLVTDALKTISKRVIHKTADSASHLVGNQIAEIFTKAASNSTPENPIKSMTMQLPPTSIPEEICIPPKKQQQITDELRLL